MREQLKLEDSKKKIKKTDKRNVSLYLSFIPFVLFWLSYLWVIVTEFL